MPIPAHVTSPHIAAAHAPFDHSLTVARSYLASGMLGQAEVLLQDAYEQAKLLPCPDAAIRALILLGDMYRSKHRYANATGKYNQALEMWLGYSSRLLTIFLQLQHPSVQPSAFMPALGECTARLGGDAHAGFLRRSKMLQMKLAAERPCNNRLE